MESVAAVPLGSERRGRGLIMATSRQRQKVVALGSVHQFDVLVLAIDLVSVLMIKNAEFLLRC